MAAVQADESCAFRAEADPALVDGDAENAAPGIDADGQDLGVQRAEVVDACLQPVQLREAERSPVAAVEGHHDLRAAKVSKPHPRSILIRQVEVGRRGELESGFGRARKLVGEQEDVAAEEAAPEEAPDEEPAEEKVEEPEAPAETEAAPEDEPADEPAEDKTEEAAPETDEEKTDEPESDEKTEA